MLGTTKNLVVLYSNFNIFIIIDVEMNVADFITLLNVVLYLKMTGWKSPSTLYIKNVTDQSKFGDILVG